jgi:hypothetical protein
MLFLLMKVLFAYSDETFAKRSILPAQLNLFLLFNRGSRPRKAKILTTPVRSAGPTPVPSAGATGQAGQAGIHFIILRIKI